MRNERGFSLIDMVATVAILGTVMAIATPPMLNMVDQYKLGSATRTVERELQFARLKAVSGQTWMRVRFNCPTAGQIRVVELVGTPAVPDPSKDADSYTDRCSETLFPYRPTGADQSRLTKPNNDGAIRYIDSSVSFSSAMTLEFWPDGSVHASNGATNPWPNIGGAGKTITLARKGVTKNIVVNGLGKIQMDR
jgi:Tfp pilus assembly protein FimT